MNISEAQTKYDEMLPDDNECEECEKHIRRGDESFDLYEQECKSFNHLQEQYEELADKLRERDERIMELSKILISNNIDMNTEK